MVVCASCFYDGNYQLILTNNDFTKKTVIDSLLEEEKIQESEKKKSNTENRIADAIEKNRFRIQKTAEQVKMPP